MVANAAEIYVAPACWSRGIGRALLACAVDRLVAQRYASCFLWVLLANARARRFYERAGFSSDPSSVKRITIGTADPLHAHLRRRSRARAARR
jgi:ribosomal protein S18 acetylase RimI-like enzyme